MVPSGQACSDEALQYFTLHYSVRLVGYSRNMGIDVNFKPFYQNTDYVEHRASDPISSGERNANQNVKKKKKELEKLNNRYLWLL